MKLTLLPNSDAQGRLFMPLSCCLFMSCLEIVSKVHVTDVCMSMDLDSLSAVYLNVVKYECVV